MKSKSAFDLIMEDTIRDIPGFTFGLEKGKDVLLSNWTLDISDDRALRIIHKLDSDLCDTSTRSCAAEHFDHFRELHRDFGCGWILWSGSDSVSSNLYTSKRINHLYWCCGLKATWDAGGK
jgi:hypothetical protein